MAYCNISKEIGFDAGHRVPKHKSKCRNPHGHRYRVVVQCTGKVITESGAPDEGMLIDFGDLKKFMMEEIHDPLDHGFIVHEDDQSMLNALEHGNMLENGVEDVWRVIVFPYIPTAENIARWCWEKLEVRIKEHFRDNLTLDRVTVWETPTSMAEYWGYNGAA